MRRSKRGFSLIEFALSTVVVIPVALMILDFFLIICAIQLNDSQCKEAARLASSGDPRWTFARAVQGVAGNATDDHCPLSLRLVGARTTITASQLEALKPYGGLASGAVDVATEVSVRPLILHWFLGGEKLLRFRTHQEVPSTYVMPNVLETACIETDQHVPATSGTPANIGATGTTR
jgi:hypothetical protein